MAEGIELTPRQANAVAETASKGGAVVLRQLASEVAYVPRDVYVTVVGTHTGLRITPAGDVTSIGETLPATEST